MYFWHCSNRKSTHNNRWDIKWAHISEEHRKDSSGQYVPSVMINIKSTGKWKVLSQEMRRVETRKRKEVSTMTNLPRYTRLFFNIQHWMSFNKFYQQIEIQIKYETQMNETIQNNIYNIHIFSIKKKYSSI